MRCSIAIVFACLLFACDDPATEPVDATEPVTSETEQPVEVCGFAPTPGRCVCGFKDTAPESEWPFHQAECDFLDGICDVNCCRPGREPAFGDPTRCVATRDEPTKRYYGPYPDLADPASETNLLWNIFGAETCVLSGVIDGVPFAKSGGQTGIFHISDLVDDSSVVALSATVHCENQFGILESRYSIPDRAHRVTTTQLGARTRSCWQVLPFYLAHREPFHGTCHLEVCPPGVPTFPGSTFPCSAPSHTTPVTSAIGCFSTPTLASGTTVWVTCESGDQQTEIDVTTVP